MISVAFRQKLNAAHLEVDLVLSIQAQWDLVLLVLVTVTEQRLTKAWARWEADFWRFWLQFLPLPLGSIQLIKLVGIFAIFHHPSKHQDPSPIADKAVSCATWWRVTLCRRNKPLISSCAHNINKVCHFGMDATLLYTFA